MWKYYSAAKIKLNLVICNRMDGARGHYSKCNKLGVERQIPHVLSHLQELKEKFQSGYRLLINRS